MIARAAEGSVRDALSLLDQAIAYGAGRGGERSPPKTCGRCSASPITARIIDLFEAVMRGDIAEALGQSRRSFTMAARIRARCSSNWPNSCISSRG